MLRDTLGTATGERYAPSIVKMLANGVRAFACAFNSLRFLIYLPRFHCSKGERKATWFAAAESSEILNSANIQ
jgi:hypothetical protein